MRETASPQLNIDRARASTWVARAHAGLAAAGVPANVAPMQAYLKTTEPFFGVKAPARKAVLRSMADLPLKTYDQVHAVVAGLWALPEREARYLAIDLARKHRKAIVLDALPLYERMVREGAWWDLVDPIAVHLVGALWMAQPDAVTPVMDRWIEDPHLWIRRTALLAQLRHKGGTDTGRLFAWCAACAEERDFFVRKAIGWALREHGRTDPDAVWAFLDAQGDRLSGLSRREAARNLPPRR